MQKLCDYGQHCTLKIKYAVFGSTWKGSQLIQHFSIYLHNYPPYSMGSPSDTFLQNKIWPRWWEVTSKIRLPKTVIFLAFSHSLADETICPMEMLIQQGMKKGIRSAVTRQLSSSVQKPMRNLTLPHSHVTDPYDDCSPGWAPWLQPCEIFRARRHGPPCLDPWPT